VLLPRLLQRLDRIFLILTNEREEEFLILTNEREEEFLILTNEREEQFLILTNEREEEEHHIRTLTQHNHTKPMKREGKTRQSRDKSKTRHCLCVLPRIVVVLLSVVCLPCLAGLFCLVLSCTCLVLYMWLSRHVLDYLVVFLSYVFGGLVLCTRQDETRQGKVGQDNLKTRSPQERTRQDKTGQEKKRQDNIT
jgi:hypothetical protein